MYNYSYALAKLMGFQGCDKMILSHKLTVEYYSIIFPSEP